MANIGIYLAYDNAKSAMKYYEENFGAKIIHQLSITPEMNEMFKLPEEKLADSTYSGQFEIAGMAIACSDKVDNNGDFNDSFNIMLNFNQEEEALFNDLVLKLESATPGEIIFDSRKLEGSVDMTMFRFKDKFDIIWSLVLL